jgi:hypothetical protein
VRRLLYRRQPDTYAEAQFGVGTTRFPPGKVLSWVLPVFGGPMLTMPSVGSDKIYEGVSPMTETVMNTKALPDILFKLIPTEKVRVKEIDGMIQLMPVKENTDCTVGLRGILAGYDEMSVDRFLERKRTDKELEQ